MHKLQQYNLLNKVFNPSISNRIRSVSSPRIKNYNKQEFLCGRCKSGFQYPIKIRYENATSSDHSHVTVRWT